MPDHNPFHGITDLFTELARARETGTHGRDNALEDRQRTHASAWVPTTDIFVQGDRLVIRIELAGVEPEDIDLRFANGVLTVSGNRDRRVRLCRGADLLRAGTVLRRVPTVDHAAGGNQA